MRLFLLTLTLSAIFITLKAQSKDGKIYTVVEKEPEFPGGIEKFYSYLHKNIRAADSIPKQVQVQTILLMEMIIEKDGSISHIRILKDTSPSVYKSAINTLSNSPKWMPGLINGKPVRVRYKIRMIIEFQLDG